MASLQLEQVIKTILAYDYTSLVILTAVGYDYILTFSKEIEYVWKKPWTWVSTLFVISRYFGLCEAIFTAIAMSSFFPAPTKEICESTFLLGMWGSWIFLCAAELAMILRVWALYGQSRLVLGILLTLFVVEIITLCIYYVMNDIPLGSSSTSPSAQILQFSLCNLLLDTPAYPIWLGDLSMAVAIALGALMCLLTVIRFVKEFLLVYKATKSFQVNRYMKCLAKEGTVYFIAVLLFALFAMLVNVNIQTTDNWLFLLGTAFQTIPPVTLVPRFIMSLRELYAQDVQGSHIDTAFGFASQARNGAVPSTILFADARQDEDEERGDEIQVEETSHDIDGTADSA